MKILIVANYNPGYFSPFVTEQAETLHQLGCDIDYYKVIGKGAWGYLKNLPALKRKIKEYQPDIVHAHYGLSGLLATLQREVPVVVTYHGSDIHEGGLNLLLSKMAIKRAAMNIFVARHLQEMANCHKKFEIIPCGADDSVFVPMEKAEARKKLGWSATAKIVAFAGAFDRAVKNPQLAKEAMRHIPDAQLIELKGFSRQEVNLVFNAADCLLMTSHNEGSPQVIKEAMLTNTPIVSVPVGDVPDICQGVEGCIIAEPEAGCLAHAVRNVLERSTKTNGRDRIYQLGITLPMVAQKILRIYQQVSGTK